MGQCCDPLPSCPLDTSVYYGNMAMSVPGTRSQLQYVDDRLQNYVFNVTVKMTSNGAAGAGNLYIARMTRPGLAPDKYALDEQTPDVLLTAAQVTAPGEYTAEHRFGLGANGFVVYHTFTNIAVTRVMARMQITPEPMYGVR